MTATQFVKQEILSELKKGNTDVLKGLPPHMAMSLGMAVAEDVKEESPLDDKAIKEAMLNRMADSGVKDQLLKKIEQENKDHADKVEKAKQVTKEIAGE